MATRFDKCGYTKQWQTHVALNCQPFLTGIDARSVGAVIWLRSFEDAPGLLLINALSVRRGVRFQLDPRNQARVETEGRLQRQFDVVIERDEEGCYVASVLQLPGCHTQARSLDEVTVRIREAVELCLEVGGAPEHSLELIGIQRITIAA
jgi:predicted RNase H-like HicB family nuclease